MSPTLSAAIAITTFCLMGCAELTPYRTEIPSPLGSESGHPCTALSEDPANEDSGGSVSSECAHRMREDAAKYRLYFAEFDDQGWAYPAGSSYGSANRQLEVFTNELKSVITKTNESISVVVFVHGWKHTARSDDANVKRFRLLLESLDLVEQTTGCKRKVIGLYVGWRGAATTLGEPIESLTFYNRKDAAERVALGDVRVLFSQLRAQQDLANRAWNERVTSSLAAAAYAAAAGSAPVQSAASAAKAAEAPPVSHSQCDKRMRLSIAGHSFGGLIVYTSLAQALIRDIVDLRQAEEVALAENGPRPTMSREGDLVVVVNPAIEATRFEPLYMALRQSPLPHYHAPLFVAITSSDDGATGRAFPLGRSLSTLWERYAESPDRREKRANTTTLGQDDDFMTHRLSAAKYPGSSMPGSRVADPACGDWANNMDDFAKRLDIEADESAKFLKQLERDKYDAVNTFPRTFCSTELLTLKVDDGFGRSAANSPVWNVRTSRPIVNDHNDFSNPHLIAFFRQLYREAEFRDEQVTQRAK
jgi:hypothetical protein